MIGPIRPSVNVYSCCLRESGIFVSLSLISVKIRHIRVRVGVYMREICSKAMYSIVKRLKLMVLNKINHSKIELYIELITKKILLIINKFLD